MVLVVNIYWDICILCKQPTTGDMYYGMVWSCGCCITTHDFRPSWWMKLVMYGTSMIGEHKDIIMDGAEHAEEQKKIRVTPQSLDCSWCDCGSQCWMIPEDSRPIWWMNIVFYDRTTLICEATQMLSRKMEQNMQITGKQLWFGCNHHGCGWQMMWVHTIVVVGSNYQTPARLIWWIKMVCYGTNIYREHNINDMMW